MTNFSQNNNQYVVLNYDELNEKGLKNLVAELARKNVVIDKLIPAENPRKIDGIFTRTFSMIASDAQRMDVRVNDTGDISQVKLNGKVIPITEPKSVKDLGARMASAFVTAAPAFKRSFARKLKRASADAAKKTTRKVLKSLGAQLKEVKKSTQKLDADIKKVKADIEKQETKQAALVSALASDNANYQNLAATGSLLAKKVEQITQELHS